MAKVFVTHVPNKKDIATGASTPAINITPAAELGEIIVMMPPHALFQVTTELVEQLDAHLKHYNYDEGDCVLTLGDPVIIAAVCGIMGKRFSRFKVLRWDRQLKRYFAFSIRP